MSEPFSQPESTDAFIEALTETMSKPLDPVEDEGETLACKFMVGKSDSGLTVTPETIATLRQVGLESLAAYYEVVYKLAFE